MNILITGGAASGKSAYAEQCAAELVHGGRLYYIATLNPDSGGDTAARIEKHRAMRKNKGFVTIECADHLENLALTENCTSGEKAAAPVRTAALLEDTGNLVANSLFTFDGKCTELSGTSFISLSAAADDAARRIAAGIAHAASQCSDFVCVTNSVTEEPAAGRSRETVLYVQTLAVLNNLLAATFDEVTEVVAGIPVKIKSKTGILTP